MTSQRHPRELTHSRPTPTTRRTRHHDERGAVLVTVSICLVLVIVAAALAVDIGRTAAEAAHTRNVVDLTAIDAARALRWDSTKGAEQRTAALAPVRTAAIATAKANGLSDADAARMVVKIGGLRPGTRTGEYVFDESKTPFEAVLVLADTKVEFAFAEGSADPLRFAVARVNAVGGTGIAAISAETYAADINTSRVALLGPVLKALGTEVSVGVLNDLEVANPSVSLLGIIRRLNPQVDASTLNTALNATYDLSTFVGAVVSEISGTSVGAALRGLNLGGTKVTPSDFIKLPGTVPTIPLPSTTLPAGVPTTVPVPSDIDYSGLSLGAYDIVEAALMSRVVQRSLSLGLSLKLSDLTGTVPVSSLVPGGLLAADVTAKILSGPVLAVGGVGTTARTAQVELGVVVSSTAGIRIPLSIDVASGSATISEIACQAPLTGGIPTQVKADAKSALATPYIGDTTPGPPKTPIKTTLLNVSLESITSTLGTAVGAVKNLLDGLGLGLIGNVVGSLLGLNPNEQLVKNGLVQVDAKFPAVTALPSTGTHSFLPIVHAGEIFARYGGPAQQLVAGSQSRATVVGPSLTPPVIDIKLVGASIASTLINPLLTAVVDLVRPLLTAIVDPIVDAILRLTGIGLGGMYTSIPWAACDSVTPTLVSAVPVGATP